MLSITQYFLSHIKVRSFLSILLFSIFSYIYFPIISTPEPNASYNSSLNSLNYRNHLLTSSSPSVPHSRTLTFDSIYVLSLPARLDRRNEMLKLAEALEIEIKFIDAVDKNVEGIKWIAERVKEVRDEKIILFAKAQNRSLESIGGLRIGSDWLASTFDLEGTLPLPFKFDARYHHSTWTDYFQYTFNQAGNLSSFIPEEGNESMNVGDYLWDIQEKAKGRQVNEGVISTYFGHTLALKEVIKSGDKSALILEDDVDVEFDLETLWNPIEKKLPKDWEVVLLGHCWGRELLKPAYLHPLLHQSTAPMCLHAYAVSNLGAKNLLSQLYNPWTAFQAPVNTAIPTLISKSKVVAFSIEPPLFIQRKDSPSDIRDNSGSKWKGVLRDSTVERIKKNEGILLGEDVSWESSKDDPANMFRYKIPCRES